MRDPNRIDVLCEKLAYIWKQYPDLRLGQLFNNLQALKGSDLYYTEDEDLLNDLQKMIDNY